MRFSPARFLLVAIIAALWVRLVSQENTRALFGQHLRLALAPPQRYVYDELDDTRAEDRVVNVLNGQNQKSLLERYPNDVALLAACMRRYVGKDPDSVLSRRDGPLTSRDANWSVIAPNYQGSLGASPLNVAPTPQPTPPLDQSRYYLSLIKRGQKLEPRNTFWDWMEMAVLIGKRRDAEVDAVLQRAILKNDFNDHTSDEIKASVIVGSRRTLVADAKTMAMNAAGYHHVSPMYATARFLAQRTMGLRLQGRDEEALQHGLRVMRLARIMRLRASMPLISDVGKRYEIIVITKARLSLRSASSRPSLSRNNPPLTTLASDPNSLLLLAQSRSPQATREIATEWQRLGGWNVNTAPDLFGGLVEYQTVESLGWTQRATLYLLMSVPMTVLFWALVGLLQKRRGAETRARLSPWWGVAGGVAWMGVLLLYEYLPRTPPFSSNAFFQNWATGTQYHENILTFFSSWAQWTPRVLWGGAVVWLLWLSAWQKTSPLRPRTPRRIEDWEQATVESLPFRLLDRVSTIVRWWGMRGLPLLVFMGIAGAMGFFFLVWQGDYERDHSGAGVHIALLLTSVVLMTLVAVGLRALITRRRDSWARFFGRSYALLTGYVAASLLVLPILLWANSRFEHKFNQEFAPIENGQMVAAIRHRNGLPIQ